MSDIKGPPGQGKPCLACSNYYAETCKTCQTKTKKKEINKSTQKHNEINIHGMVFFFFYSPDFQISIDYGARSVSCLKTN